MNRFSATTVVREKIVNCMVAHQCRMDAAGARLAMGDGRGFSAHLRSAEVELQRVAELISIENHLNGVSPE